MNAGARLEAGPYRGLRPFGDSDLDALLFFGRERERAVLVANLLVARLTVLYGPSGVGKSSLVRAGVVHELRAQIDRDGRSGRVVVYERWAGDPRAGLAAAIEEACGPLGPVAGLADVAAAASQRIGGPLYLILDQFEEYFLYQDARQLTTDLLELVGRPGLAVNVLISLRDDALSQLDVLKQAIPDLFANSLRLDRLDRQGARRAITAPLERYGELSEKKVTIEPELIEEVLDQVAVERSDSGVGAVGSDPNRDGEIEAPYLQLVLERLWQEEMRTGSASLTLSTLRRLGGAETIVRDHLDSALVSLNDRQLDAAAAVFNQLVTPSGTKIAHRPEDLAEYAQLSPAELAPVLGTLVRERILRMVEASGSEPERCEIFHDVLAHPIATWRSGWAVERERRAAARQRRRLLLLSGGALAALLVVAAIAVFAFVQRSHAREDARRAQARELAANALAELSIDGEAALSQALRAAQLAPGEQTENVLRETLIGSYERAVAALGGTVSTVSFDRSGNRLLAASTSGLVRLLDRRGHVLWSGRAGGSLAGAFFTPDGRSVFAAGGKEFHVWNVEDGRELRWGRFRERITAFALAPDGAGSGDTVLVGDRSGVKLVQLRSGAKVRRLATPGAPVSIKVSADGSLLAVIAVNAAGRARTVVYELPTGKRLHVLPGDKSETIAFAPHGQLLATGSGDRMARLWNPRSGRVLHVLAHEGGVPTLAFSPDGGMLATGSADGATRVWSTKTGERLLILAGPIGGINSVAFSASGRFLIAGSSDRTARVYDAENGRELALLTGDREAVTTATFSPDEELALTGSSDGTARIWDPGVADQLRPIDRARGPVRQVTFSPDGQTMAIVRDHILRLRRSGGALIASLGSGRSKYVAVSFSPSSRLLAAESSDGLVRILRDGAIVRRLQTPVGLGLAFARDDRLLTLGLQRVDVWALPGGRRLRALPVGARVAAVAASSDGRTAATLSRGEVRLWNLEKGVSLGRLAGRYNAVSFSPDGRRLVTTWGNRALLWETAGRRLLHVLAGHTGPITHFVFARRGDLLVTGSRDHDARVWSAGDGRLMAVLRGHFSPIYGVSVSSDGRWVATAGQLAAGLWQSTSGQLLFYLRGPRASLTSVSISPDGRSILAGSMDGAAYAYRCDVCGGLPSLEALAEQRVRSAGAG
ncbi:MAG: PQQ-binding-like beta-propeller repeat protein [Gaiellaceae bacterium]